MHGVILHGLKRFVTENYGAAAWSAIQDEAGVEGKLYVPVTEYPDEDVLALVSAAAERTGEDPGDIQRSFGEFVVPYLVEMYGVHVEGEWTGIDLLANVEAYIHQALRAKELSEFTPPGLGSRRYDDDTVLITYGSDRQLCDVAKGIVRGVEDHYDESYAMQERRCMHEGAEQCELVVKRTDGGTTAANG